MTKKADSKRVSEAQKNLERIEKLIQPYVKSDDTKTKPISGKWQQAPTPVHKGKKDTINFTRQDFIKALQKVSSPDKPDDDKS